jgi:carboxymethylenebutenolidase
VKLIRRILVGVGFFLFALILLLVISVAFDAWIGQDRVLDYSNKQIQGPDGQFVNVFLAYPETPGPHPAVIMIHEWWGLRPDIVEKAEALAEEGYVVVAPDTYRGRSTGWIPRAIYLRVGTDVEQVNVDLDIVYEWLEQQPEVRSDRIAVMGFCYGGEMALYYSLHNDRLVATGVFYGSLITDPAVLSRLPGPLLGIFGAEDVSIPVQEVNAFEDALEAAGIPHQITIYEDVGHAFVTDMDAIRAGGAQGAAWAELLTFLDDVLAD